MYIAKQETLSRENITLTYELTTQISMIICTFINPTFPYLINFKQEITTSKKCQMRHTKPC